MERSLEEQYQSLEKLYASLHNLFMITLQSIDEAKTETERKFYIEHTYTLLKQTQMIPTGSIGDNG